ncbi:MAG: DUF5717 family protein [Clostridium sp.]
MCGLRVHADGDFINLPQTVFTEADFQDDHCEILYRIDGMHLHQGRNLGAVWIRPCVRESVFRWRS